MDYRYGSHTVYQIEYHFVWVTKYRYKVLTGEVASRVRELVRETCEAFEIRIVRGVVSKEHVHILVRGYFCATVGQMTEEMIQQYLEHHFEPNPNDEFKMEPD